MIAIVAVMELTVDGVLFECRPEGVRGLGADESWRERHCSLFKKLHGVSGDGGEYRVQGCVGDRTDAHTEKDTKVQGRCKECCAVCE